MEKYQQEPLIRDENLLESALASVKNIAMYNEDTSIYDIGAGYCYFICQNHPFVDGNKRTAFFLMTFILNKHHIKIIATSSEIIEKVKGVARGELNYKELALWLRKNTKNAGS